MSAVLDLLLKLTLWFLLTADSSLANILIGTAIALLLPKTTSRKYATTLKDWLSIFWKILVAIPIAFVEAIEIMLRPHRREDIVFEKGRTVRSPGLIFLDIFLITFTPKTIVMGCRDDVFYEVHRIRR
ncbi:MAG: Na+/H+ antiporter subunit E [Cyanobacteria bacterium J06614_10]